MISDRTRDFLRDLLLLFLALVVPFAALKLITWLIPADTPLNEKLNALVVVGVVTVVAWGFVFWIISRYQKKRWANAARLGAARARGEAPAPGVSGATPDTEDWKSAPGVGWMALASVAAGFAVLVLFGAFLPDYAWPIAILTALAVWVALIERRNEQIRRMEAGDPPPPSPDSDGKPSNETPQSKGLAT